MDKRLDYKKNIKYDPCAWCDFLHCRKGHKCSVYKREAKKYGKKGRQKDDLATKMQFMHT